MNRSHGKHRKLKLLGRMLQDALPCGRGFWFYFEWSKAMERRLNSVVGGQGKEEMATKGRLLVVSGLWRRLLQGNQEAQSLYRIGRQWNSQPAKLRCFEQTSRTCPHKDCSREPTVADEELVPSTKSSLRGRVHFQKICAVEPCERIVNHILKLCWGRNSIFKEIIANEYILVVSFCRPCSLIIRE